MRFLRSLAAILALAAPAVPAFAQTNYTTNITLSNLLSGGVPVPSAKICATPADVYGNPITVSAPGWGLNLAGNGFCQTATNGALPNGLNVPDAHHTYAAAPIRYNFSIQTLVNGVASGAPVVFTAVPDVSGSTFALDSYSPAVSVQTTASSIVGSGPGVPLTCTAPSLYVVVPTGTAYTCVAGAYIPLANGASFHSFNVRGVWQPSTYYAAYDVFTWMGSAYSVTTPFTSGTNFSPTNTVAITAGLNVRGAWSANTPYSLNDLVGYNGSTYVAIAPFTSGSSFDPTNLAVLAAAGSIGISSPPADATGYAAVNPNSLTSQTALNPGVTVFCHSGNCFGMDLGFTQFGLSTRIFAPTGYGIDFAMHPQSTTPTGQASFATHLGFWTQYQLKFFPGSDGTPQAQIDSSGNITGHSVAVDGAGSFKTLTINSTPFSLPPTTAGPASAFHKANPSNVACPSSGLSPGYSIFNDSGNVYGWNFGCTNSQYSSRFFTPDNAVVDFSFYPNGTPPAGDSALTNIGLRLSTTAAKFFLNPSTGNAAATLDSQGNFTAKSVNAALTQAAGSPFTASDAVAPNTSTSLVQVMSHIAARRGEPVSHPMSWTGMPHVAFGDSITAGFEVYPGQDYSYLASQVLGTTLTNKALAGDQTSDCALKVFNFLNLDAAHRSLLTVAIGANDVIQNSYAPSAAQEALFNLGHRAILAWLGTRKENRVDGGSVSATGWSNDTTFTAVTGAQSTTNGASISYSITTTGKPIYVWYRLVNGSGGAFTATVASGSTTVATANLTTAPPAPIATVNGGTTGVGFTSIAVPAGTYTVTYAVTSATGSGNLVGIVSTGTPSAHTYFTSPTVLVGGILPFQGDAAGAYSAKFTADVIANVYTFRSDGLDMRFVDNRSVMQDGALPLYSGVGDPHPNQAGHVDLAPTFVQAARLPPAPAVNKAVPPSSGSGCTPGDLWPAPDSNVYACVASGLIQRVLTAAWQ